MRPLLLRNLALNLGYLSFVCIIVAHLALTDIYHGEGDLTLAWHALQVAFGVIIAFHFAAFAVLIRLRDQQPSD